MSRAAMTIGHLNYTSIGRDGLTDMPPHFSVFWNPMIEPHTCNQQNVCSPPPAHASIQPAKSKAPQHRFGDQLDRSRLQTEHIISTQGRSVTTRAIQHQPLTLDHATASRQVSHCLRLTPYYGQTLKLPALKNALRLSVTTLRGLCHNFKRFTIP